MKKASLIAMAAFLAAVGAAAPPLAGTNVFESAGAPIPQGRIDQLVFANLARLGLRSMTHRNHGHETAAYLMQTAHAPGERLAYPSVGAVFSLFKTPTYKGMAGATTMATCSPRSSPAAASRAATSSASRTNAPKR